MIRSVTFLTIFLLSCGPNYNSMKHVSQQTDNALNNEYQVDSEWELDRIDSSKLIFKNGRIIETKLNNLEFIGQINVEHKDPYLIFTGVDCKNCDANPSIYVHSPSDGELIIGSGKNTYGTPGRIFSYLNDSLLYEGRVFYGQILENKKGVIWYQKTHMKTGKWESSVFIAEIKDNRKVDQFLIDTGLFKQTIYLLQKGLCKEIEGKDQTSEP
jgi:hypothetical protein